MVYQTPFGETYSAFSNGYGGVIILGVIENKDGTWFTSGLDADSCQKLIKTILE